MPKATQNGFLSIDLLTALAIFALLLGVSIPSISYLSRQLQLKRSVQTITSALRSSASRAAQTNAKYVMTLNENGYQISRADKSNDVLNVKLLPKNIYLEFAGQNSSINFNAHGSCSPAAFRVTNGTAKCQISVSLRCRVSSRC